MTLWDLLHAVARRLTGQRVIIRLQAPIYKGLSGCVQKRADGLPVLDIEPTLPDSVFIDVFLHELAHVKLHAASFYATDTQRAPRSVENVKQSPRQQVAYDRRETEADKLAAEWLGYANRQHMKYDGYTILESQLLALANKRQ